MPEKNLWRSSILCKVAGHRPTTLSKVSVLRKYYSCILLKLIITLAISMIGSLVSNKFKVLFNVSMLSNLLKKETETAVERYSANIVSLHLWLKCLKITVGEYSFLIKVNAEDLKRY